MSKNHTATPLKTFNSSDKRFITILLDLRHHHKVIDCLTIIDRVSGWAKTNSLRLKSVDQDQFIRTPEKHEKYLSCFANSGERKASSLIIMQKRSKTFDKTFTITVKIFKNIVLVFARIIKI